MKKKKKKPCKECNGLGMLKYYNWTYMEPIHGEVCPVCRGTGYDRKKTS